MICQLCPVKWQTVNLVGCGRFFNVFANPGPACSDNQK